MRLLIIGALEGQLSEATKLAMQGGAKVQHASTIDIAMSALRAGRGALLGVGDLVLEVEDDVLAHGCPSGATRARLRPQVEEPERIEALLHLIEDDLGFAMYRSVDLAKCRLSEEMPRTWLPIS